MYRARMAAKRTLTMANLFENLVEVYGEREAMLLDDPPGHGLFPSARLTTRDCVRFTNLAAEAFIRDLDLKKGERVVLLGLPPSKAFLVAVAAIKAGAIVVPLDPRSHDGELRDRVRGCGAELAVVDGRVLAERPHLAEHMPSVRRLTVTGPREDSPQGLHRLEEAMHDSSGFFIPYTLKPSNVAALFHARLGDGSVKAVMVTNQGLVGGRGAAALLYPARPGSAAVCAFAVESAGGFAATVLALLMGSCIHMMPDAEPERILEVLLEREPAVFVGDAAVYEGLMAAGAAEHRLGSLRLWFAAGGDMQRRVSAALRGLGSIRLGPLRLPALLVESYGAQGNATVLALRPSFSSIAWPQECPGLVVPPNRMRVVDEAGRRVKRGESGELIIKGPAVTPGYWNDLEGTLAVRRDGWIYTGIRARRTFFSVRTG